MKQATFLFCFLTILVFSRSLLADPLTLPEAVTLFPLETQWQQKFQGIAAADGAPRKAGGLEAIFSTAPIGGRLETADDPARPDNLLGRGYNGLSSEIRRTCLTGRRLLAGNEAKKVDYSLHVAGSSDEYRTSVHMSAGAAFGLGSWSTDASVSYFQSSERSRYVDHLVVRVVVLGPNISFEEPNLTAEARRWARSPLEFYRLCGNRYIRSLSVGGEFVAIVDIETSSESERSELRATLSVIAKGYGSANAEYEQAMQRISRTYQKNVRVLRNGLGERLPEMDIDTLVRYSLTFPEKINTATGVPVGLQTTDYRTVDPSIEIFSNQEIMVEFLANKFGKFYELLGDLNFYSRKRNSLTFYPPLSDDAIRQYSDTLGKAVLDGKLAFNACVENPATNCKPSLFPSVTINVPAPAQTVDLNPKIGTLQYVGTAGAGETKTAVVLGNWSPYGAGENLWNVPEQCCFDIVVAYATGAPVYISYRGPVSFVGPARVSVHIGDSVYDDNRGRGLVAVVY